MVDDLQAFRARLVAGGVSPSDIESVPAMHHDRFTVREPGGNVLRSTRATSPGSPSRRGRQRITQGRAKNHCYRRAMPISALPSPATACPTSTPCSARAAARWRGTATACTTARAPAIRHGYGGTVSAKKRRALAKLADADPPPG
jgi:hypothetical protein